MIDVINNLPYFCLVWMGVGFILFIIGIFMLAGVIHKEEEPHSVQKIEEMFSYFLEEEEKKNNAMRDAKNINSTNSASKKDEEYFDKIIELYQDDMSVEEIAKKLRLGVGEVNLILTLYKMR